MSKIYINAYTLDCALGNSAQVRLKNLQEKKTFSTITCMHEEQSTSLPYFKTFAKEHMAEQAIIELLEKHIFEVIEKADWQALPLREIPIFLGSTSYTISSSENELLKTPSEELESSCYQQLYSLNMISNYLKEKYNHDAIFNMATSCTSSANALIYSKELMDQGLFDKAIVVGFELSNLITLYGFLSLGLISERSLPFTAQSEGLILGEGISALALSTTPDQNNSIQITIEGAAAGCDTYNIATTVPDGERVKEIMHRALKDAAINPTEIKVVKAHATGSPVNDLAEFKAINSIFPNTPLLLLKPYLGHTLGASGTIECALLIESLKHGNSPSLPSRYSTAESLSSNVMVEEKPLECGYYLLNYLGFGGSNASLVLGYEK